MVGFEHLSGERLFNAIAEAYPQPVYAKDRDGRYVFANPAMGQVTGRTWKDLRGKTDTILDPEGVARWLSAGDEAVLTRGEVAVEQQTFEVDGTLRTFRATKVPVRGDDREVIGLVAVTQELTEETRLADRAELLLTVVESAADLIFAKGPNGRYRLINERGAAMLGGTPDEYIGRAEADFVPPETAQRNRYLDEFVRERGERVSFEHEQTVSGVTATFLETRSPLLDPDGQPIGVVGVAQDVTKLRKEEDERRSYEARFLHAQKLESLGVLAGGIAHDFNNLLVAILGNADVAASTVPDDSPMKEDLGAIIQASKRAGELCQQLLAYAGKGQFEIRPIDLTAEVIEMASLLEVSVAKTAELRYRVRTGLPLVQADGSQIRQIIMNLMTNASEALQDRSGTITISTGTVDASDDYLDAVLGAEDLRPGRYVYVEVSDDGVGMDAETRDRVFEPFYTTKFAGRGLGLAAALGIVRSHEGGVLVTSAPERGTTFRVLLPASDSDATVAETRPPVETTAPVGSVLVVDDEKAVRRVARRALEAQGFQVVQARDGQEAVDLVRSGREHIDVVLLDLTMPRMNGAEAFGEIRGIDPTLPVVLSSGYNERETMEQFSGQEVSGFVQKPYTAGELLSKIRTAMADRSGGSSP